jgi:hypothetical protein
MLRAAALRECDKVSPLSRFRVADPLAWLENVLVFQLPGGDGINDEP